MFTVAVIVVPLALLTWVIEFVMAIPNMWSERKQFAMFKRERTLFK